MDWIVEWILASRDYLYLCFYVLPDDEILIFLTSKSFYFDNEVIAYCFQLRCIHVYHAPLKHIHTNQ